MEINVHELSDKQLNELALKIRKGIQKDRENEKKSCYQSFVPSRD